jgi:hypothetical protein
MEAICSGVEIKIKEEKVYAHLDEEKERDAGTWVLDTEATNHMSGCRAALTKLDTAVLGTVHFGSVARIEGCGIVVFVCNNGKSRSLKGVYFIPRLTNKIDINTGVMKIQEPGGLLLARVKREVNRLYLLHIKLTQPACFAMRKRGDEVVWCCTSASGTSTWQPFRT